MIHDLAVHPRGCGERLSASLFSFGLTGSSPRVRGTPPAGVSVPGQSRFIPAGAGNATRLNRRGSAVTVHPRGCGERTERQPTYTDQGGSSPRVRGTPAPLQYDGRNFRFIPAGAGNADKSNTMLAVMSVHPRGCGERIFRNRNNGAVGGSSPRVRGTLYQCGDDRNSGRFIPAGAGNAPPFLPEHGCRPVHPRGCGERVYRIGKRQHAAGSSPRVRGTRQRLVGHVADLRFIPAGAGNASFQPGTAQCRAVHPRGCGERTNRNLLLRI